MIIVSQDKKAIVNFDNVSSIDIYPPFDDTDKFEINAERVNGELIELGIYETEERAKEVLQEIIDKFMEYGQIQNLAGDIKQVCEIPKKYEMPEE